MTKPVSRAPPCSSYLPPALTSSLHANARVHSLSCEHAHDRGSVRVRDRGSARVHVRDHVSARAHVRDHGSARAHGSALPEEECWPLRSTCLHPQTSSPQVRESDHVLHGSGHGDGGCVHGRRANGYELWINGQLKEVLQM